LNYGWDVLKSTQFSEENRHRSSAWEISQVLCIDRRKSVPVDTIPVSHCCFSRHYTKTQLACVTSFIEK